MAIVSENLGKRVLISTNSRYSSQQCVEEVKIIEMSPSGKFVKVCNSNGNKFWKLYTEVVLIEVLDNETKPLR